MTPIAVLMASCAAPPVVMRFDSSSHLPPPERFVHADGSAAELMDRLREALTRGGAVVVGDPVASTTVFHQPDDWEARWRSRRASVVTDLLTLRDGDSGRLGPKDEQDDTERVPGTAMVLTAELPPRAYEYRSGRHVLVAPVPGLVAGMWQIWETTMVGGGAHHLHVSSRLHCHVFDNPGRGASAYLHAVPIVHTAGGFAMPPEGRVARLWWTCVTGGPEARWIRELRQALEGTAGGD